MFGDFCFCCLRWSKTVCLVFFYFWQFFSVFFFFLIVNPFRSLKVMDLLCWYTWRNSNIVPGLHSSCIVWVISPWLKVFIFYLAYLLKWLLLFSPAVCLRRCLFKQNSVDSGDPGDVIAQYEISNGLWYALHQLVMIVQAVMMIAPWFHYSGCRRCESMIHMGGSQPALTTLSSRKLNKCSASLTYIDPRIDPTPQMKTSILSKANLQNIKRNQTQIPRFLAR